MDAIHVCPNCQAAITDQVEFCRQCGKKLEVVTFQATHPAAQTVPPQSKNRKKRWFVLACGLIFLCFCACLAVGGIFYGDQILEMAGIDQWDNLPNSLPGLGSKTLKGDYHPSGGETSIQYSISKDNIVTFSDGEQELASSITDNKKANVEWKDMILDGDGALTSEEQAALEDFSEGNLGEALLVVPFNLACRQGNDRPTAEQMAALLVPLQMHLKYAVTDRWAEVQRLAALSDCPQVIAGEEKPIGDKEEPPMFQVSSSDPVPFVMGYFPFDEKGAIKPEQGKVNGDDNTNFSIPLEAWLQVPVVYSSLYLSSGSAPLFLMTDGFFRGKAYLPAPPNPITHTNELGSCGAKCRGACGVQCTTTNCKESRAPRCLTDKAGKNTGHSEAMIIYDCGVATGCVQHDACYDACNEQYGCDSWMASYCMHGSLRSCDEDAAYNYGPVNCAQWATGRGTFERNEIFQYSDLNIPLQIDFETCPISVGLKVAPASVTKGIALKKYQFEWMITDIPDIVKDIRVKWDFGDAGSKDNPPTGEEEFTADEAATGQAMLEHSYAELGNYELTIEIYDAENDFLLASKTIPVVIDQMYDLSGYWYIQTGDVISSNVTCTGEDETDPRLFPLLGSLVGNFGSFTRDPKSGEYNWSMNAGKLPPDANPGDFTFTAKAAQSADGVILTSHTNFPQSSSNSWPLAPRQYATVGIGLAALPIVPLAWMGVRRKSRVFLAGALMLLLLAAGCSGFIVMYGNIDGHITFKKVEQTNNTQPATITFGGSGAPAEGLYRLSDGVARYTVDFSIGGGVATMEGETEKISHCTGIMDVEAIGIVYKDLTIIIPENDD
jgi:hypothetical protein